MERGHRKNVRLNRWVSLSRRLSGPAQPADAAAQVTVASCLSRVAPTGVGMYRKRWISADAVVARPEMRRAWTGEAPCSGV